VNRLLVVSGWIAQIAAGLAPRDRAVTIHGFTPDTLVITAGTTALWTN